MEFKIIRLANYQPPTGNRANRNRNLLAHWFYGSDELVTLIRDPLQFDANYTGFSRIAADDFTLCDLPLAVFFWNDNQISFVDQWAVRRRLVHPYPAAQVGSQSQRPAAGRGAGPFSAVPGRGSRPAGDLRRRRPTLCAPSITSATCRRSASCRSTPSS